MHEILPKSVTWNHSLVGLSSRRLMNNIPSVLAVVGIVVYGFLSLFGMLRLFRQYQRVQKGECEPDAKVIFARDMKRYFRILNFSIVGFILLMFMLNLLFRKQ